MRGTISWFDSPAGCPHNAVERFRWRRRSWGRWIGRAGNIPLCRLALWLRHLELPFLDVLRFLLTVEGFQLPLFDHQHLLYINEGPCFSARLLSRCKSVEINSGGNVRCVPLDRPMACILHPVDECSHLLPKQIVHLQCDITIDGQRVPDYRCGIKRVWIILHQRELLGLCGTGFYLQFQSLHRRIVDTYRAV